MFAFVSPSSRLCFKFVSTSFRLLISSF
ncbi:hypothetical protein [Finegoldia magna]